MEGEHEIPFMPADRPDRRRVAGGGPVDLASQRGRADLGDREALVERRRLSVVDGVEGDDAIVRGHREAISLAGAEIQRPGQGDAGLAVFLEPLDAAGVQVVGAVVGGADRSRRDDAGLHRSAARATSPGRVGGGQDLRGGGRR